MYYRGIKIIPDRTTSTDDSNSNNDSLDRSFHDVEEDVVSVVPVSVAVPVDGTVAVTVTVPVWGYIPVMRG